MNRGDSSKDPEARGVVVLAYNESNLLPYDASKVKEVFKRRGVKPVNIRISPEYVEVQAPLEDYSRVVRIVEESIGAVLEVNDPATLVARGSPEEVYRLLEALFEHQLFWRAHIVAEAAWRKTGRECFRLLAVVAASSVKAQEGEEKASQRLVGLASEISSRLGVELNADCLYETVRDIASGSRANPLKCLEESVVKRECVEGEEK